MEGIIWRVFSGTMDQHLPNLLVFGHLFRRRSSNESSGTEFGTKPVDLGVSRWVGSFASAEMAGTLPLAGELGPIFSLGRHMLWLLSSSQTDSP